MTNDWTSNTGAQWVWPSASAGLPNQYVQFLHEFDAPVSASAELLISADTNYAAWLNGTFIGTGQWSDYPNDKTYNRHEISSSTLAHGNRLCILVWYQGESTSQYLKGTAGGAYILRAGDKVLAASGPGTRMRRAPDYVSGPMPRVTPQLSFTFEHHGEKSDGWLESGYKISDTWTAPAPGELYTRPVRPRPLPQLTLGSRIPMRVHSQGVFRRTKPGAIPAVAVQSDVLTSRSATELFAFPLNELSDAQTSGLRFNSPAFDKNTGPYVMLDTGREEAGLVELELDAPAGTVVDVAYGEHLEDGRVRAHLGGRNFANRHVCPSGRHTFLHPFLRIAGRYLQVHITPAPGTTNSVTLHYAGIRPTDYPVQRGGAFESSDPLINQIWQVSDRTLHLCMHEHYEDCPWREQALYGGDMRNQARAGYYCFGNYDFAAESIALLAKGRRSDGFLELCAPASVPVNIPCFSLIWILTLDDYLLYSGDRQFVRTHLPVARRILNACVGQSTGPLIVTPQGPGTWNFYEWAPGLDGSEKGKRFARHTGEWYDAPLNLFYLLALDAAARMADEVGESSTEFITPAAPLRSAVAPHFWDETAQALRTRTGAPEPPHYAELTQALAILAGAVPADKLDALRERLASDDNGLVPCTLSHCMYKFDALLTAPAKQGRRVFELIARDWGHMLNRGATSFWETIDGAAAFQNAGSLCHGWSGIPAYYYGAYLLGVRPTEPGFSKYVREPVPGVVQSVHGKVPTPAGPIVVVETR